MAANARPAGQFRSALCGGARLAHAFVRDQIRALNERAQSGGARLVQSLELRIGAEVDKIEGETLPSAGQLPSKRTASPCFSVSAPLPTVMSSTAPLSSRINVKLSPTLACRPVHDVRHLHGHGRSVKVAVPGICQGEHGHIRRSAGPGAAQNGDIQNPQRVWRSPANCPERAYCRCRAQRRDYPFLPPRRKWKWLRQAASHRL